MKIKATKKVNAEKAADGKVHTLSHLVWMVIPEF
jgi:hypothetical protein